MIKEEKKQKQTIKHKEKMILYNYQIQSDKVTPCLDLLESRINFVRKEERLGWFTSKVEEDIACERYMLFKCTKVHLNSDCRLWVKSSGLCFVHLSTSYSLATYKNEIKPLPHTDILY